MVLCNVAIAWLLRLSTCLYELLVDPRLEPTVLSCEWPFSLSPGAVQRVTRLQPRMLSFLTYPFSFDAAVVSNVSVFKVEAVASFSFVYS